MAAPGLGGAPGLAPPPPGWAGSAHSMPGQTTAFGWALPAASSDSSWDGAWEALGGPGTREEGHPGFQAIWGYTWARNIHTLDTKQRKCNARISLFVLKRGSRESCLTYFIWKAVIWGGHGSALNALGSATDIKRNQLCVINRGLKEGGQPLWLVGRIGNRPSGANRALITIPFQPNPFLEGTIQHQIWTQFQIQTAKPSGQFQWTVSSVMNSRILTLVLGVILVARETNRESLEKVQG